MGFMPINSLHLYNNRTGTIFIITILIVQKTEVWEGKGLAKWLVAMDTSGAWIQVFCFELPYSSLFPMLTPWWSSWLYLSLIVYINDSQSWVKIWRINSTLCSRAYHTGEFLQPGTTCLLMNGNEEKVSWESICNP